MRRLSLNSLSVAAIIYAFCGCAAHTRVSQMDSAAKENPMTQPASRPAHEFTTMPEGCILDKFTVPSKSMHRDIKAVVVLPPAYAGHPDARFPVLYTLHGSGAPYDTFAQMQPLRRSLLDHPMIVTCFDGDPNGWYVDSTTHPESQFATFFFQEFIPYIDAHYRTKADGHSRGVTGFSMGGYGAFNYLLMHPDMFASASSLSGVFDYFGELSGKPSGSLARLLGPYEQNKATYLKYGIYNRMEDDIAKGIRLPPMFITCGTEDRLLGQSLALLSFLLEQNAALQKKGQETLHFQYAENSGAHQWAFWRDSSAAIADFHWRSFEQAAARAAAATKGP
jgi:S-formylglutathione hydrolase FrmB